MSEINLQNAMLPPWLKYPKFSRGDMGWQIEEGQEYWYQFYHWFHEVETKEQENYQETFPEPKQWRGFYALYQEQTNTVSTNNDPFKGVCYWEEAGLPKYNIEQFANQKRQPKDFILFWGHTSSQKEQTNKTCLSQWWLSSFSTGATSYCCMEQYMMAEKARVFEDEKTFKKIMNSQDQKTIKDLGREVKNFDSAVWDKVKYSIVLNGNYYKFTQDENLMTFLLSTEAQILVEASPYDSIWGIGLGEKEESALMMPKWRGLNLLGFALMEVRDEIKRVYQSKLDK